MLQRIFLNGLLLSFLIGSTPYIKGWDISQDIATSSHEFLSYAVPFGFLSYLLYSTFSRYNCYLEHLKCKEQIITREKFLNPPEDSYKEILKFIRTECKRAGHPNSEKIEIALYGEKNTRIVFSQYPGSFLVRKTSKYDVILLSETDYFSLRMLNELRKDIGYFRTLLFCAAMDFTFEIEGEVMEGDIQFSKSILYSHVLVDNEEPSDDFSKFNSSCDPEYLTWIKGVEGKLNTAKLPYNCQIDKSRILGNLNKIAYMSDEYLNSCLEKILDMWAAAIHHESGHLQSRIPLDKLKLIFDTLIPIVSYGLSTKLASNASPYKRLGLAFMGTAMGLLLSKWGIHFIRYFEELRADNNVVAEKRYLLAASDCYSYMDWLEGLQLRSIGIEKLIKYIYSYWTDVHPSNLFRARKFYYRAKQLKH